MTNAAEKTNSLLDLLRRLGRGFAEQYVRGVTMQYRYLIDGPPQQVDVPRTGQAQKTHIHPAEETGLFEFRGAKGSKPGRPWSEGVKSGESNSTNHR